MPLSKRVGSKVPSAPFVTELVPEAKVVQVASPVSRYSSCQEASVALLAVPTTVSRPVTVVPSAGLAIAAVGGGPDGVGVAVGVAVVVGVVVGVGVFVGVPDVGV